MSDESINFTKTTRTHQNPHVNVEMSTEQFNVLQNDSKTYGDYLTLSQLAEQDPDAAYDRFRRIIGHIVTTAQADSFTHSSYEQLFENGQLASVLEKTQGMLTTETATDEQIDIERNRAMDMLPETPDNLTLTVSTRLKKDEAEVLGMKSMHLLTLSFNKTTKTTPAHKQAV